MINKESVKRALKQMEWEIDWCKKPIDKCISCQDAETLIELVKKYLDGKLIETK